MKEVTPLGIQTERVCSICACAKFQGPSFNRIKDIVKTFFSCLVARPAEVTIPSIHTLTFYFRCPMSNCAKYQVSSFNSLRDIVKRNFGNVGGATCGGGSGLVSRLLPVVAHAIVSNCAKCHYKSLALIVSEIWLKEFW